MKRSAFFISDRTGITAENLGHSLLSQFDGIEFQRITLPFVDTAEKAQNALASINAAGSRNEDRPLVFSTLILPDVRNIVAQADALFLDLFEMFIVPLEAELGVASSHALGRSHGVGADYAARMEAVNYALRHDDGGVSDGLPQADIILTGVSRSGKTPTSLYLALQFGIHAANYPLVPEDFSAHALPAALMPLRKKVFGFTIAPERLHQIRAERAPDTQYSSLENCRNEVRQAEMLMTDSGIPMLDVTSMSVEEIATTILHRTGLRR